MTGFLFHINHVHFGGYLSPTEGVTFEQLSSVGAFEAWDLIPLLGKMQIIFTIAGLEHASECLNPAGHYTKGGTPGDLKFLVRRSPGVRPLVCSHRAPFEMCLHPIPSAPPRSAEKLLGHSGLH